MSNIKPNAQDIAMLHRIFGWHAIPWTDVFCEAVSRLETRPRTVLEVGASRLSAPSLYFLRKGVSVDVTCYADEEVPGLKAFCKSICEEYGLPMPPVRTHDVFSVTGQTYDVVILKGVLGGLDRNHNMNEFSRAIDCCLGMLSNKGRLIILDKGWCSPVHNVLLRRFGNAGGTNWHYFSQKELDSLSRAGSPPLVIWKGFASLGTMPFKGLQHVADFLDTRIFNRFLSQKGTVFAALYSKDGIRKTQVSAGGGLDESLSARKTAHLPRDPIDRLRHHNRVRTAGVSTGGAMTHGRCLAKFTL